MGLGTKRHLAWGDALHEVLVTNKQIQNLVAVIGGERTIIRLLEADHLSMDAESFVRLHFTKLGADTLLSWLSKSVPVGADGRPTSRVVDRVIDTVNLDLPGVLFLPAALKSVNDDDARDEIIERLQPQMEAWHWLRIAAVASAASEMFGRVLEREVRIVDGNAYPPSEIRTGETLPLLTPRIFAHRRDDNALRAALRHATQDPATRLYAIWMLRETKLLSSLGTPDDVFGQIPLLSEIPATEHATTKYFVDAVGEWPSEVSRSWRVRRILDAAARGVRWSSLWWECDASIRDVVAMMSLNTPSPAPWAFEVVSRTHKPEEAWPILFRLLDGAPPEVSFEKEFNAALQHAALLGLKPVGDSVQEAFQAIHPRSWTGWFTRTSLPDNADGEFDERYAAAARRLKLSAPDIAKRLAALPLSKLRARRIVSLMLDSGVFWEMPDCLGLANAAGEVEFEVPLPEWPTQESVSAFKVLAGPRADSRISAHHAAVIAAGDLHKALSWVHAAPQLQNEPTRSALRTLAQALPVSGLVELRRRHAWLIDDEDVTAAASKARDAADWGSLSSIPASLCPYLRAASLRASDADVAGRLLDRLEELGTSRRDVLQLALERVDSRGVASVTATWWASKLGSRSLWVEVGVEVVTRISAADKDAASRLGVEFFYAACSRPNIPRMGPVLHEVLAEVLVRRAGIHLTDGHLPPAVRALKALAHLNAPSRLRAEVLRLRKTTADPDVLALIEVNADLLRRTGKDEAVSFEALLDALRAYVGDEELAR